MRPRYPEEGLPRALAPALYDANLVVAAMAGSNKRRLDSANS